MKLVERGGKVLVLLILLALLYLSSLYSYLLFHSLAEIFSVCIALTVFFITWNSRDILRNNYLLLIGVAYLFIGFMDVFHTLSYPGMAIFKDYDYYANQLWVAARYFESVVLLLSFLLLRSKKKISVTLLLAIYAAATAAVLLTVFVFKIFPIAFVKDVGLTPFKKISEYVICVLLIAAILVLRRNKSVFEPKVYRDLVISMGFTILTELCFTEYISNYDFMNLLGHYFKIASFYFIYRAVIQTGIREPYNLIFREMRQTEHQLREHNEILSKQTLSDNLTIQEHISLLRDQYKVLNRQSQLLDLSREAIFAWDFDGAIFYWNDGAEAMYGFTRGEATGRISDELLQTVRPVSLEETRSLLERNGTWVGTLVQTAKDGRTLLVESSHQLCTDDDGRRIVLELCRDITEQNKLEADVRYRNMLLYAVVENMHDALFVFDSEGVLTSVNARARELYQDHIHDWSTADNIFGDLCCCDLDNRPIAVQDYPTRRVFRGESITNERLIIESGGWSRVIEVNGTPIVDAHDRILATVVCHHDVTDLIRKQRMIEEHMVQLQQQNKILNRQAKLLDLSNEAIFAWYLDGPIIYWNHGAEKMYGYSDDDAVGCNPQKLIQSRFPIDYGELRSVLLKNGAWTGHIEHTTRAGRQLIVETRMQVIPNDLGLSTVLETNRDVTEKIKADNATRKKAIELSNIINSTDDFIWSVDADYRIIFCNKETSDHAMTYYGVRLAPGVPLLEVLPEMSACAFREFFERARREGEFSVDMQSFRGDRSVYYTFHPVYFDGTLFEITVFGRDITERIKAEQEIVRLNASLEARIQERTQELQKSLDTIQKLTLMVTHDLKAPLQEIGSLAGQIKNSADITANAEKIGSLSAELNEMIGEFLEYERLTGEKIRPETVDIKSLIEDVFSQLETSNTSLEFETGMPKVRADKLLLRRVVMNLLSNAVKFSSMREKPRIIAGCRQEHRQYIFTIRDNGIGLDMAYAHKLFNVFERLHDNGEFEGHGIGLASCRSIIEKHGGRIWIQGKPNAGATVFFMLPVEPAGGVADV